MSQESEKQSETKVGFVGLGNMGGPMATNLMKAGFDLTVFDKREGAMASFKEQGASSCDSLIDMSAKVDVICTCVLYDHQVKDIFLGENGILRNAKPGLICTIHSTVLPDTVIQIANEAKEFGVQVLDAPVSGGSVASEAGTLTIMVGGDDSSISRISSILSAMGENVIRVGEPGMGQVAKLGNNIMSLCNQVIAMEAVRFAQTFGLEKDRLFEVAKLSTGASWALSNYEHFDRFGVDHTLAGTPELPNRLGKDLRYAIAIAQDKWTYLPIVALCSQLLPPMMTERWNTNVSAAD